MDENRESHHRPSFDWLALWILLSTWSSLSGWGLSLLGQLNVQGVLCSYLLFFAGLLLFRHQLQVTNSPAPWRIFHSRRFRYILPRLWFALTILVFVGGLVHSPTNYDYLTYRFSRVLNWSWNQGWYWIPTVNKRMNYSGTGMEWLMTPLFLLFKTDRLFFLINFVSYLFMPGLVFSVFSRLGISKRISWWWMWVLPCGYCFILQAGSVGNDSYSFIYFFAALHYLLRLKDSPPARSLFFSCLAIALMTGVKASTVPLGLPWAVLLFLQRRYLFAKGRALVFATALIIATAVSFVPVALLNIHYTGDFSGDADNSLKYKITNPVSGVLGNTLQLASGNLAPPVMPRVIDWSFVLPASLKEKLLHDYPRMDLRTGELQMEEETGAGLGVVLFAGLLFVMGLGARFSNPGLLAVRNRLGLWVAGAFAIAFLVYMAKMGVPPPARLMAVYYPPAVAALLLIFPLDGRIVGHALVKWFGLGAMLSALPLVILSPARPLFPVQTVADLLARGHVPEGLIERYNQVYAVYATRADAFHDVIVLIPPQERTIGFLQISDDPAATLWRPFGTRRVIEVTPADSPEKIRAEGIHYLVVGHDALLYNYQMTSDQLAAKWSATVVAEKRLVLKAHVGPETWYLFRL